MIANVLQNIIQAYQSDDEEPPLLQENIQVAAMVDVVLPDQVQVVAEQLQLVSPNSDGAHATDGVSASSHLDLAQPVLLEVALEATLV